jgi:hypothetical protein
MADSLIRMGEGAAAMQIAQGSAWQEHMIGLSGWPGTEAGRGTDETRCRVEVQTTSGRAAAVDFRVRLDTVDAWRGNHCAGVFVRETLERWLADPVGRLVADEVELSLDRAVDRDGRVALTLVDAATNLPEVLAWTLSPGELLDLRKRVGTSGEGDPSPGRHL